MSRAGLFRIVAALLASSTGFGEEDKAMDVPPNPLEKTGWILTAHDEFDGPELNADLWTPYYLEYLTTRERSAARYAFRDGCLVLRIDQDQPSYYDKGGQAAMRCSTVQTGQRTGLHLAPKTVREVPYEMNFSQKYGYFEIRARTYRQPGYHSAFWTVGVRDEPWQEGEIDIMEQPGNGTGGGQDMFNLHIWGDKTLKPAKVVQKYDFDPGDGFNIYALEWDEKSLKKYVNNELVAEIPQSPSYPMLFFLSIYENAGWTGKADTSAESGYPKEFVVDYFRAYARDPDFKMLKNDGGRD